MSIRVSGRPVASNDVDNMTGSARERLGVMSYLAHAQFAPRGIRTRALLPALREQWNVEMIASPPATTNDTITLRRGARERRLLGQMVRAVLLDKFEPRARRQFRKWRPDVDAALLIGFPFSPLAYAARGLAQAGVPYVVDIGDPWALTAEFPAVKGLALVRARRMEREMWNAAAGAIVTTQEQAEALQPLFPKLPLCVRPNGYDPSLAHEWPAHRIKHNGTLRLGHFGSIYDARLNLQHFLNSLAACGYWDRIEFHQYGVDWTGTLSGVDFANVVMHDPRPWRAILHESVALDAAIVIGNRDAKQLPSKAIDYLVLPIPRIALTAGGDHDALGRYAASQPGWLVVQPEEAAAAKHVRAHVQHVWTDAELAPPASEAWPAVAHDVTAFVTAALQSEDPALQLKTAHRVRD
jgi:hypothetical protein